MEENEAKRRGRPLGSGMARAEAAETMVAMRVVRDFWDGAGERVNAGAIVEVPLMAALRGVKSGALDIIEE